MVAQYHECTKCHQIVQFKMVYVMWILHHTLPHHTHMHTHKVSVSLLCLVWRKEGQGHSRDLTTSTGSTKFKARALPIGKWETCSYSADTCYGIWQAHSLWWEGWGKANHDTKQRQRAWPEIEEYPWRVGIDPLGKAKSWSTFPFMMGASC